MSSAVVGRVGNSGSVAERLGGLRWSDLFASLYGANSPEWQRTLGTWAVLFHAEGRANHEMLAAVQAISRHAPVPQFPTQFLDALRSELRRQDSSVREASEAKRLAEIAKPIRCRRCGDCGWVVGVPHVEFVAGPEWLKPRRSMAVTCDCGLGRHIHGRWENAQPEAKKVLSFSEYEGRNPHWQTQMELRRVEVAAEMAAHEQQHGAPSWRRTVEAIVRRYANADR